MYDIALFGPKRLLMNYNINNMESNIKNKGIVQKKKERFTNSFVNFQSANAVTNFICDEHF